MASGQAVRDIDPATSRKSLVWVLVRLGTSIPGQHARAPPAYGPACLRGPTRAARGRGRITASTARAGCQA